MELTLIRHFIGNDYTIGKLLIDEVNFCDTLEPPVSLPGSIMSFPVAIPVGTYDIEWKMSPTFKIPMPYLLNVPGRSDIMIHVGNSVKDTHGCILVGRNTVKGALTNSGLKFDVLYHLMQRSQVMSIHIY
jgi:hypothetical protein